MSRWVVVGGSVAGLGGLVLLACGGNQPAGAVALLAAFWFLLSAAAGWLGWALILVAVPNRWSLPLRGIWSSGWPLWLTVIAVALLAGWQAGQVFPWAGAGHHDGRHAETLAHRGPWNGVAPLVGRTAVLLGSGLLLAILLRRWDRGGPAPAGARRLGRIGLPVLILLFLPATMDWLFATTPHFHSSVTSLLQLVAGGQAAFAAVVLVAWWAAQRRGILELGTGQWYALGSLLVATSCVWAYLHLSQALIITMSDRPHQAHWWLQHTAGAWGWIALALGLVRFVVPFLILLRRRLRERPGVVVCCAAPLLPAHAVEALWWVAPTMWSAPATPGWRDGVGLVAGLLLAVVAVAWAARDRRWRPGESAALSRSLTHHPAGELA